MGVTDSRSRFRLSFHPPGKRIAFEELLEDFPFRGKEELVFVFDGEEGSDLDFAALLDGGEAQADWCRASFRSTSLCSASLFLRGAR